MTETPRPSEAALALIARAEKRAGEIFTEGERRILADEIDRFAAQQREALAEGAAAEREEIADEIENLHDENGEPTQGLWRLWYYDDGRRRPEPDRSQIADAIRARSGSPSTAERGEE